MDVSNDNNLPGNVNIQILSESNHYTNQGGRNSCAERGLKNAIVYIDGKSIYDGQYTTCGDVVNTDSSNSKVDIPPYEYNLMNASKLKSVVTGFAGAD